MARLLERGRWNWVWTVAEAYVDGLPPDHDPARVVQALTEAFRRQGDGGDYLNGMRMAVPGVGELYGVRVPLLRAIAREVVRAYRGAWDSLWSIALASWAHGSREHQVVALFIFEKVRMDPPERWALGVRLLPDVNNWETCDQLCAALLGEALARDPRFMDELERMAGDENFWVRRAALVAPVYLRRAKFPDDVALELDRRTLVMCGALLEDGEKYIRKAVDWSIRETIKRRYDLGKEWMLAQAAAQPSRMARTTLKLASKKLVDADQAIFLRVLEPG
jgi:3-methyladenine DNA glycosylase AlkD